MRRGWLIPAAVVFACSPPADVTTTSPCGMSCAAFSAAGCSAIEAQCDALRSYDIAVAGQRQTQCLNALTLACGGARELRRCFDRCATMGL